MISIRNARKQPASTRPSSILTRLTAVFLFAILLWLPIGESGIASAATTVSSVRLDELTPDEKTLYVEDGSLALLLWANLSVDGSARTDNVTNDATWISSNSAVTVNKGVVTANGEATNVVITGKYQGYSASVTLNARYRYSGLTLKRHGLTEAAPDKLDVQLGESHSLDAFGVDGGAETDLTAKASWTSSNEAVATVDKGVVTLVAAGKTTITAKYQGRTDKIEFNVTLPYKTLAIQSSDGKAGPFEMQVGEADQQLKAMATKSGGGKENVASLATWKSSNEAVATVDEKGKIKAVSPGTATITATYMGSVGTATLAVRAPYEALQLSPNEAQYLSLQGEPLPVTAKAVNGASTDPDLIGAVWESANLLVASVSGNGGTATITPRGEGTTKIKLTYKGVSKELSVTVYPTIEKMELGKTKLDVYVDDKGDLPSVKGTSINGGAVDLGKAVTWTSSDEGIVSLDEDGKWKALDVGTATLTAKIVNGAGGEIAKSLEVNVTKKALTLIADNDNVSIVIGKEVDLPKIRVVYEDGNEEDVTDKVTWKSSSTNLVVREKTLKGLLPAKVTLTGTYSNKTVRVQVTVEEEYASFVIEPAAVSLTLNKSQSIKVTGNTKSGKKVTLSTRVEWQASSNTLLTVKGSIVKSLAEEGSGKLTASIQGKQLEVPVTVKAKLSKLTVSEPSLTLAPGASEKVVVTAVYENGRTLDVTSYSAYTAPSAKVAKATNGTVTAVAKGSVTIKAAYGGKTVSIRVKVK
ncbi:Ig-like domain-containing protein [Cohnella nanjingensis]|uniref:Ig-like domain-containing protein n=1 Tax=Cohnella nanjingensis TaxID=1387779 RepID=A0A7X0VF66_9BACL|nr:Ig-like domain-containing protein [Cohnella nanjingensis]MBB6671740.1 Ig-like domain-containing protein [Cohnella nanjingensis]